LQSVNESNDLALLGNYSSEERSLGRIIVKGPNHASMIEEASGLLNSMGMSIENGGTVAKHEESISNSYQPTYEDIEMRLQSQMEEPFKND